MNRINVVILLVCLFFTISEPRAEGGVHTQSAKICGQGLEESYKTCKKISIAGRIDDGQIIITIDGQPAAIKADNCQKTQAKDFAYYTCRLDQQSPCGVCAEGSTIFVVRDFVIDKGALISRSGSYTVGCGLPESDPSSDQTNGAIGKCLARSWFGYDKSMEVLNSCIRMVRADYCGSGCSQTEEGVLIQAFPKPTAQAATPSDCSLIEEAGYEAAWSSDGATQFAHKRWASTLVAYFQLEKKLEMARSRRWVNTDVARQRNKLIIQNVETRFSCLAGCFEMMLDAKPDAKTGLAPLMTGKNPSIENRSRRYLGAEPAESSDPDVPNCKHEKAK